VTLEWKDHDGDRCHVSADPADLEEPALAVITVTDRSGDGLAVYVYPEQAKNLEAFFAGLVMSLPAEQRA
jgi:hypothetical protein